MLTSKLTQDLGLRLQISISISKLRHCLGQQSSTFFCNEGHFTFQYDACWQQCWAII